MKTESEREREVPVGVAPVQVAVVVEEVVEEEARVDSAGERRGSFVSATLRWWMTGGEELMVWQRQ
jgi:hypothetical protein